MKVVELEHRAAPVPTRTPPAPRHLKKATKLWWASVVEDYALEPHHLHLLQAAGEAWDRYQQARMILSRDGLTTRTANGLQSSSRRFH